MLVKPFAKFLQMLIFLTTKWICMRWTNFDELAIRLTKLQTTWGIYTHLQDHNLSVAEGQHNHFNRIFNDRFRIREFGIEIALNNPNNGFDKPRTGQSIFIIAWSRKGAPNPTNASICGVTARQIRKTNVLTRVRQDSSPDLRSRAGEG